MTLEAIFQAAVESLRKRSIDFAVAGGLAADLYRDEPRLTMDVDLGIMTEGDSLKTAISVIESLNLKAGIVREADFAGGPLFAIRRQNTLPYMVVGRPPGEPSAPGVDILLPSIPWTADAIRRAQDNVVDFGFGDVPVLLLEDVIVAKLFALRAHPIRAKDLDDLQSIFAAGHDIDKPYLAGQLRRYRITIPDAAQAFLPKWLLELARDMARAERRGERSVTKRS
jgi:hypothetical protein